MPADPRLKDLLRPILPHVVAAVRARLRAGPVAPSADFSAADAPAFARYFIADSRGRYPGDLHTHFGLGARAFADGTGLVRAWVPRKGGGAWAWVRAAEAFSDGPAHAPAGSDKGGQFVGKSGKAAPHAPVLDAYEHATGRVKDALEIALANAGVIDPDKPKQRPKAVDPKHVATALAATWQELHRLKYSPEELGEYEKALAAAGVDKLGEPGAVEPFTGTRHDPGSHAILTGTPVRVTRPGWQMTRPDGGTLRLAPAGVEPAGGNHSDTFADAPGSRPPHPGLVYDPRDHHYHKPGDIAQPSATQRDIAPADAPPEPHHETGSAIADELAKQFLAEAADPHTWGVVAGKATAAAASVYGWMVRNTPQINAVLTGTLEAVLDSPQDMQKFGYAPVNAGPTATGQQIADQDPMREHIGISTHLAMSIASKVLARGLVWMKGRLAAADGTPDVADTLAGLFAAINDGLGAEVLVADAEGVRDVLDGLGHGGERFSDWDESKHDRAKDGKFGKGGGGKGKGRSADATGGREDERGRGDTLSPMPDHPPAVAAAVRHESELAGLPRERGYLIAPDGSVVAKLDQAGDQTELSLDDADAGKAKDAVLTHNHPKGSALSVGDFFQASRLDLAQMRAVTPDGTTHAIDRPAGGWPPWEKIGTAADEAGRDALAETDEKVAAGELSLGKPARDHLRQRTAELLADRLGVTYTRADKSAATHSETVSDAEEFAGRPGLVQKKISYQRGGKTYQRMQWVKAEQAAPAKPAKAAKPAPATPTPAAKPVKPPPAAKPDPATAKAAALEHARGLLSTATPGADHAKDLHAALSKLTVPEIQKLKAERDVKGGKSKAEHVAKLLAHAQAARAKADPAPAPASPHAAVRSAMDAMGLPHGHLTDDQLHAALKGAAGGAAKPTPAAKPAAPADAAKVAAATATMKHLHATALDPSRTAAELRSEAQAVAAGLDLGSANAVLAGLGYREPSTTEKDARDRVVRHAVGRRGAIERANEEPLAPAKKPKPATTPKPATPTGDHIDKAEQAVRAEVARDAASGHDTDAGRAAELQPLLDRIKATHTPDEVKELARRVTGKPGRTVDDALSRLRYEMAAVSNLVRSQKV